MLSKILDAFCLEIQALFAETGNTILRDTQFRPNEMPLYTLPAIVLSLKDNPEIKRLIGGITKADFGWHIKAYFYDINADLSIDDPFSTEAYEIIHTIYQHISAENWLTNEFKQVLKDYGYKLTLNGMQKAETLAIENGVCPGFSIIYDSVGFDTGTADRQYTDSHIENVNQSPENAFITLYDTSLIIGQTGDAITFSITANTPFVIESDVDWLVFNPENGNTETEIELAAVLNDTGIQRTAILTIKAPTTNIADQIINIIQNES